MGEMIWYHPDHFKDDTPIAQYNESSRSPLDLAVHWAQSKVPNGSGPATNYREVISGIANGLYEDGGFGYIQDTNFHYYAIAGKSDFYLDDALRAQKLECVDYQVLCKIFSNYVGVPAKTLRLDYRTSLSGFKPQVWTNYIKMAGANARDLRTNVDAQWNAPKSLNVKARDFLYQPEGQPFGSALGVGGIRYDWSQMMFGYHQVVLLDDGGAQLVWDASARTDRNANVFSTVRINSELYFNQLNLYTRQRFEDKHVTAFGLFPSSSVYDGSRSNYFSTSPLDDVPIGDNLTTFLAKAFYLANSPTDRESSGFNEDFPPRTEPESKLNILFGRAL